MLAGGLEIVGLLVLLIGCCELIGRLMPRRLVDEMQEIVGDVAAPCPDQVSSARRRGAL